MRSLILDGGPWSTEERVAILNTAPATWRRWSRSNHFLAARHWHAEGVISADSRMDASRLMLAAKHYVTAETCRDPVVSQRATRCAEYLLSKVKREEEPLPLLDDLLEAAK